MKFETGGLFIYLSSMTSHSIFVCLLHHFKSRNYFSPVGDFAVFWMLVFILQKHFQKTAKTWLCCNLVLQLYSKDIICFENSWIQTEAIINTRGTLCKVLWTVKYHLFPQDLEKPNETSLFFSILLGAKCHTLRNHLNRNVRKVAHCNYREGSEGCKIQAAHAHLLKSWCVCIKPVLHKRLEKNFSWWKPSYIYPYSHKEFCKGITESIPKM